MRFVGKRLALFVAALVGLSALVFVMLRVLPGDVAAVIAGTNATPERIASLRAEFGLDKPLAAQYGDWMAGMLHGDLGVSAVGGRPVARQIAMRAAVTFPLIVLSLLIALAIGLPLGCAMRMCNRSWPAVRRAAGVQRAICKRATPGTACTTSTPATARGCAASTASLQGPRERWRCCCTAGRAAPSPVTCARPQHSCCSGTSPCSG